MARLLVGGFRSVAYGYVVSSKFTKAWFKEDKLDRVRELAEKFASNHGYSIAELKNEKGFRIMLETKEWTKDREQMVENLKELEERLKREELFNKRWHTKWPSSPVEIDGHKP